MGVDPRPIARHGSAKVLSFGLALTTAANFCILSVSCGPVAGQSIPARSGFERIPTDEGITATGTAIPLLKRDSAE